ncbi:MAG: TIGR00159 family protein [Candidatus Neomarinimicrobiota bacterium]|nr:MAG: TIGR00159 family protein [Candidatus Neomarinimicrobiota bacterium]
MTLFSIKFITVTIRDILDIIIVYYIFLKLYRFFKGSRAAQMFIGLAVILLLSFIANTMHLQSLSWIMGNLKTVWVIAFVIIFQPELRRILIFIGQNRLLRRLFREPKSKTIDAVIESSQELIRRKWGGLFVLAREMSLKSIKEHATAIKAEVSSSLLISIFNPGSPLHDGAVIIQNEIIEAAGCILPLSENPDLDPLLGTRHRAALGISEESDAVTIVVSEETQRIAVAYQGLFYRSVDEDTLRGLLNKLFFTGNEK